MDTSKTYGFFGSFYPMTRFTLTKTPLSLNRVVNPSQIFFGGSWNIYYRFGKFRLNFLTPHSTASIWKCRETGVLSAHKWPFSALSTNKNKQTNFCVESKSPRDCGSFRGQGFSRTPVTQGSRPQFAAGAAGVPGRACEEEFVTETTGARLFGPEVASGVAQAIPRVEAEESYVG